MPGQAAVADAHVGNFRKSGLQSGEQLGFHLAFQPVPGVFAAEIAAHIGIEQQRVADMEAVLAEAADGNLPIQVDIPVHHPERHRAGSAVLVAHQLFQIEIVNSLVLGRVAAKGKTLAHGFKGFQDALAQTAGEDGGLRGGIVGEFAGLGTELHHLALVHDHHALPVGHGNDAAVGNQIVGTSFVGRTAGNPLLALNAQNGFGNGFTVKIFLPLVGQNASGRTNKCFDKTHNPFAPFIINFQVAHSQREGHTLSCILPQSPWKKQ